MVVLAEQPDFLALSKSVAHDLVILINIIDFDAAIEELGYGMRHQVRQVRIPYAEALVRNQFAHHGLHGLKVRSVGVLALHHMFHRSTTEHVMHIHIFVVSSAHSTIEAVTIGSHGNLLELAAAQENRHGSKTGGGHCIVGIVGKKGRKGKEMEGNKRQPKGNTKRHPRFQFFPTRLAKDNLHFLHKYLAACEMSFVAAMNQTATAAAKTKTGVNGEEVLTESGVGDMRVSLFAMLNRNLSATYIAEQVSAAPAEYLEDLLVMAVQTRDIRGGKGERALFYAMVEALWTRAPAAVEALIPLIPEYGCWRDLWELHVRIEGLRPAIETAVSRQWVQDTLRVGGHSSLLAKWLPREGSKTYPGLAKQFANLLYPNIPPRHRMAAYRKAVAAANRMLGTVEIKMCGGSWSEIEPAHVPGRCFHIRHAALQNYTLKKIPGHKKRRVIHEERVGTEDRRTCATTVKQFLEKVVAGKATIKGSHVVQPHELVYEVIMGMHRWGGTGEEELKVAEAQWLSIRNAAAAAGGFGKAVPMCDFSGSMEGTPMHVSLALGILISETNHAAFRDHILTFDSDPCWHSFHALNSLQSKVEAVYGKCGQGLSTDFYKACMLILDRMKEAGVPAGEEPEDLIVLTDMGWDAAHKGHAGYGSDRYSKNHDPWKGQVAKIRDAFTAAGYRSPRIVIWNLRADYKDFHAAAEDDGVVMISGWSPNILNALQKDGVQTRTPLEALRAVLDAPRYSAVREAAAAAV